MKNLNFYERAAKLGHSVARLKAGQTVSSTISIPDVEALRAFFDNGLTYEERATRENLMFGGIPVKSLEEDPTEVGILRRVNAYIFGNATLSEYDREQCRYAFPVMIDATSAPDTTYSAGQTDLGASLGIIKQCNFGTVTMDDQAYITIENTVLEYTMDNLVRNGAPPTGLGDFNILGATGATGPAGPPGSVGGSGQPGKDNSGDAGGSGSPGTTGTMGGQGGDGLPSLAATITITTSITGAASIIIQSQSGVGGIGGAGGAGGAGGVGGRGGSGGTSGCKGNSGGCGGLGGTGGTGGSGGTGGNGINAAGNTIVCLPTQFMSSIVPSYLSAPPGNGGPGGAAGIGGQGGAGGAGGRSKGNGPTGPTGGNGSIGPTGLRGTQSGSYGKVNVQAY